MRTTIIAACVALMPTLASADLLQVFGTDTAGAGTTLSGNTYTRTLSGLSVDGVTFDATLTATGASGLFGTGALSVGASGLGVDGPVIDNAESITFTMSVSNVTPTATRSGVEFIGFSSVDFNGLDNFETARLTSDELGLVNITGPVDEFGFGNSTSFTISGPPSLGGLADFNIGDVTANFASVPEPSSLALAFCVCPLLLRRRRRA